MRIGKTLSTVSLGVVALAGSLKAESSSFTGFGAGLNLGMNSVGLQDLPNMPDGMKKVKMALTGSQVGLAVAYGMEFSGPYVGARLGYDMRFLPKADLLRNKNSFKLDVHFGMAIENIVLPTLFVGYGMNKMEFAKEASGAITWTPSTNLAGLRYGARVDFKVAPQVTVGLSSAWWGGKKTIDSVNYTSYSNETTLNVGYHL